MNIPILEKWRTYRSHVAANKLRSRMDRGRLNEAIDSFWDAHKLGAHPICAITSQNGFTRVKFYASWPPAFGSRGEHSEALKSALIENQDALGLVDFPTPRGTLMTEGYLFSSGMPALAEKFLSLTKKSSRPVPAAKGREWTL